MKRKCLAVGIILLFVGTCIVPSIAQNIEKPSQTTSRGNWLYVGGSGPGNYTKIQDAIDNASDGDTVFVYDDSAPYYEEVWIRKSISLIGENKNTTNIIWRGGRYALTIYQTEHVIISGLKFNNSSNGVQVYESNNSIISENIIEDNFFNLYMAHSNNITC
ncbi:MAG: right-handed parallel beta-helix repeat-containing protein, partial [Thermoplasmata archaeon]|nr:right-handed parallel beta-helix repeat-containing protein [Thermoplasmata archaeon]